MEADRAEIQEAVGRAAGVATRNTQIFWSALMLYPFTLLFGYVIWNGAVGDRHEAYVREAYRTDKNIIFAASPNRDSGEPPQILDLGCGTILWGDSLCEAVVNRGGVESREMWNVSRQSARMIIRVKVNGIEESRVIHVTQET